MVRSYLFSLLTVSVFCWHSLDVSQLCAEQESQQQVFRAGASTTNITPPLGELIVGGWQPLPADEVHDELHARCLVLDDGQDQLAFVICDNVGITRDVFDHARQEIERKTGIAPTHVLLASTHTHSATTARSPNVLIPSDELTDYQRFLSSRIVDAVRLAHKRLSPALIGWGSTSEPAELFNRRWYVEEESERRNPFGGVDQVRMNPGRGATLIRPAGPTDPEISFIAVQDKLGQPMALLANYSLHYVGGIPPRVVSADYFGVFADEMARHLGSRESAYPFVAMLTNGTSGDVNNINFAERRAKQPPFHRMRIVGRRIADRVLEEVSNIQYHPWVDLDASFAELTLQVRKPDSKLLEYFQALTEAEAPRPAFHSREKVYAERVRQLAESPASVEVPLQALRIGELVLYGIPFEVFAETGLELKQSCQLEDCFVIELSGGSYGYLPTPRQHELGGYETWMGTNRVEKTSSEQIVQQLLKLSDPWRN